MVGRCPKCNRDSVIIDTGLCVTCDYEEQRKEKEDDKRS